MQNVVFYYAGSAPGDFPGEIIDVSLFADTAGATEFNAYIADNPEDLLDAAWIIDTSWTAETLDAPLVGPSTHYVTGVGTTPAIAVRPIITEDTDFIILPDGVDSVTVTSVPAGTVVTFDFDASTTTLATTQNLVITSTIRGDWTWQLEPPFPYVPCVIKVKADGDV